MMLKTKIWTVLWPWEPTDFQIVSMAILAGLVALSLVIGIASAFAQQPTPAEVRASVCEVAQLRGA